MRLAALGFSHETNTFTGTPTGYDAFERTGIYRGADIVRALGESHSTMAGYLEAGTEAGVEVVPLIFSHTEPSGMITGDAFERISSGMLQTLEQQGPWDGVLLAQHGAAVSDEHADADGEIVARVRDLVGSTPIGLSLDMHANLTRRMVDNATVTVLYRTNPHVDPRARALECARLIVRTVRGEIKPAQAIETPPVVVNILKQHTGSEPMKSIVNDLKTVMRRPGMLTASAVMGYPYADVEEMGMAFLAVHDGEASAAAGAARWLARRAWARRAEFQGTAPSPDDALRAAMAAPRGPVVLMDVGDNIGGGSPGDSTVLLESARRLSVRSFLLSLYDPDAVAACIAAGVRSRVTLRVGGKTDRLHGDPVEVTGTVRVISDGRFEEPEARHGGLRFFDGGPTVVLETADEHTLLLTSRRVASTSLQQLYSVGIRPEAKRVIVAKGVVAPRAAYEPIAAEIVLVDTPGVTAADFTRFSYDRRRRPLYPFEVDAQYGDV
jgi:microcystin degradation protein MlrC